MTLLAHTITSSMWGGYKQLKYKHKLAWCNRIASALHVSFVHALKSQLCTACHSIVGVWSLSCCEWKLCSWGLPVRIQSRCSEGYSTRLYCGRASVIEELHYNLLHILCKVKVARWLSFCSRCDAHRLVWQLPKVEKIMSTWLRFRHWCW